MLQLRPMTQEEYRFYFEESAERLAQELSRAHDLPLEDARKAAVGSFERLLPQGTPNTPDQHVNVLVDDAGSRVGVLWFGIDRNRRPTEAYVWDLVIDPAHRGQGAGRLAMVALEGQVRNLGCQRISLNVFEHNAPARSLYERLGYRTVSRLLAKQLE